MTTTLGITKPTTPTLREFTRRWLFWIVAAVAVVIIAVVSIFLTDAAIAKGTMYSGTNPAPLGSMAIVEVLEQQGVEVTVAKSYAEAKRAIADGGTLFLNDPDDYLSDARLSTLASAATDVVLLEPTYGQLRELAPAVKQAGASGRTSTASDCDLPAVVTAGTVSTKGKAYRVTDTSTDATTCLRAKKNAYSVVSVAGSSGGSVTVVGTGEAFTNDHVDERGNAALALTLLGQNPTLVWYLPTIADSGDEQSIADLTPPWVPSVSALALLVVIAAAVWRGRRFGPLVVENLPVVVRSNETMEGRARLYQKGAARLHALDALRIGTVARLAAVCGLPRVSGVDEVVEVVASVSGMPRAEVRSLLVDDVPVDDRQLVRLSDALLALERQVAAALARQ